LPLSLKALNHSTIVVPVRQALIRFIFTYFRPENSNSVILPTAYNHVKVF